MGLISLLWGIVSICWMVLAFIPLLGWGNWFLIPFAAIGALIAAVAIALTSPGNRGRATAGLVLTAWRSSSAPCACTWAAGFSEAYRLERPLSDRSSR